MSLQVTTGTNSLIALGFGVSDIFTLVTLGRTVGNWWTSSKGDEEFLGMLNEDEFSILRRRGLIDLPSFNKKCRNRMRFLSSDGAQIVHGQEARNATQDLSRFTASMACIVAALDQYASVEIVKYILREVLRVLLETNEHGDDYLKSQFSTRLNAWRSTATIHGLTTDAASVRQEYLQHGLILPGTMPFEESHHIVLFLVWLLSGTTEEFVTPSSDVAGIAVCLAHLGLDALAVHGLGEAPPPTNCRLLYTPEATLKRATEQEDLRLLRLRAMRQASTTVPLDNPQECVSVFPVNREVQNRCRAAWKAGREAARYVAIGVCGTDDRTELENTTKDRQKNEDILYCFIDKGSEQERVSEEIFELARALAFVVNQELLEHLDHCLSQEPAELLTWVLQQMRGSIEIGDDSKTDERKVHLFTAVQSFFMGYYYQVFGALVNTSTLHLQTVEGVWGFRSTDTLWNIRKWIQNLVQPFSRQRLLPFLARLFLNYDVDIPVIQDADSEKRAGLCVGVVARRTLLTNTMLGKCASPSVVAAFTLLDVDVGGVPRDKEGLVRCGSQDLFVTDIERVSAPTPDRALASIEESSPPFDVSLHIEPDWEGNPDAALLCMRYAGRRISTFCPATADKAFVRDYVPWGSRTTMTSEPPKLISTDVSPWLSKKGLIVSAYRNIPVLFQALNRYRLRYAASAVYNGIASVRIASDSLAEAVQLLQKDRKDRESRLARATQIRESNKSLGISMVVIGSGEDGNIGGEVISLAKDFRGCKGLCWYEIIQK